MPTQPEEADLVIYRSVGFIDDWSRRDVPDFADDHPALLAQARTALARREAAYPAMVTRGEVTGDQAEADITGWRDLVQEWDWIVTGAGEAPHPLTRRRRLAAVDLALERVETELARSGSARRADLLRQQDLYTAIRWHLTRLKLGAPAIHFWADCNHLLRQRQGQAVTSPLCSTCERGAADPATFACTRTDCGLKQKDAA